MAEKPENERGLAPAGRGELSWREIFEDVRENLIGADRGLWYTFRKAWTAPNELALAHVQRRDDAAVRPLRYLLLAVAVYSSLSWWLLSKAPWPRILELSERQVREAEFAMQNTGLLIFLILPLFALIVHLFSWRRVPLLRALVMLTYTQSQSLLLQALVVIPLVLFVSGIAAQVPVLFLVFYVVWAIAGLLPGPRWRAWLLAALALVCAQVLNDSILLAAIRLFVP